MLALPYRPGRNAQQAGVEVNRLAVRGHPEVVDADLADSDLLKSAALDQDVG